MLSAITHSLPTFQPSSQTLAHRRLTFLNNSKFFLLNKPQASYPRFATRRNRDFPPGSDDYFEDRGNWSPTIVPDFFDEEDDEEVEDRSLDLLVRFVENVFRKVSRRARKAVRSVLPVSIPTKLVGFSVNGILTLALLWMIKAFLEVACTLGSIVFASILLVRGLWAGITYLQESRYYNKINESNEGLYSWNGASPAS